MTTIEKKIAALNLIQIRQEYRKAPQFSTGNTHEAVVVVTRTAGRKWHEGVQYWTPEMIRAGFRINDDLSTSFFVDTLYIRPSPCLTISFVTGRRDNITAAEAAVRRLGGEIVGNVITIPLFLSCNDSDIKLLNGAVDFLVDKCHYGLTKG